MLEDAREIFDYLPIEPGAESLYIRHLWGAFEALIEQEEPIRAFSILPFHLLFMFAVQYKVYRISAYKKEDYLEKLGTCRFYDSGQKEVLKINSPVADKNGNIASSCSARNLSFLPENRIFDFLRIINCDDITIEKAKQLVEIRGTYAHANGNIEEDIEVRINEYLEILRAVQLCMIEMNNSVQSWADEIEEDEYPLTEFFQERFLISQFSPRDFGDVIGNLLRADRLDSKQWEEVATKGLELADDQTMMALRTAPQNDFLGENGPIASRILEDNS